MAIFIIGAGMTRGCSFVKPEINPCLPPLDLDFFTQLQRVQNGKHQKLIRDVMYDIVKLFGNNFKVSMEMLFTVLENAIKLQTSTKKSFEFTATELQAMRDRLMQAVITVFEDSLTERRSQYASSKVPKNCDYHEKLVKEILKKNDTILSFNYDCTIDYALKKFGDKIWNAEFGYCLNTKRVKTFSGYNHWNGAKPASSHDTIKLLKMHGSLHFKITKKINEKFEVTLKERPYTKQNGNQKFTIIPPEWNKNFDHPIFSEIWKIASEEIFNSETLVFIGYSFPSTDSHTLGLFTTAMKRASIKNLVIVNPDQKARERTRQILIRGLNERTKVISFDYLSHFNSSSRDIWDS
jgi:hypothetical protein